MTETTTGPASTSPSQSPSDEELTDLPGWSQPPPRPPDPLDPSATTIEPTSTGPSPADEWPDVDELEEEVLRSTATGASSPASTDWRELTGITGQVVGLASMGVRWARTRRRPLPDGVWLADEDDMEAIGAPLARIAARHAPVTGEGSKDMVDGVELLVATTGYAMKNLTLEARAAGMAPQEGPADG